MTRYTYSQLAAEIERINASNTAAGVKHFMVTGRAYNCTQLYESSEQHEWERQLTSGTPRECLAAAEAWSAQQLRRLIAQAKEVNA